MNCSKLRCKQGSKPCEIYGTLRAASHYTILSLRRPAMAPHDAIADRTSCSVRPSAILSAAILTIGAYRRPS